MSGHLEHRDQNTGSLEISSADGDDSSSCAPPRQVFGDYETEFPTVGAPGADDPTVYDVQTFVIPEGAYTIGAMRPRW